MTRDEVKGLLAYCLADFRVTMTAEQVQVWFDLLQHVDLAIAKKAAQMVISRAKFAPRATDILRAVAELQTPKHERKTWGEAWDQWVKIAKRFGWYERAKAESVFRRVNPVGARALGTSAEEYFHLPVADLGTYKAQFRQRFEALQASRNRIRALPEHLRLENLTREALPNA